MLYYVFRPLHPSRLLSLPLPRRTLWAVGHHPHCLPWSPTPAPAQANTPVQCTALPAVVGCVASCPPPAFEMRENVEFGDVAVLVWLVCIQ